MLAGSAVGPELSALREQSPIIPASDPRATQARCHATAPPDEHQERDFPADSTRRPRGLIELARGRVTLTRTRCNFCKRRTLGPGTHIASSIHSDRAELAKKRLRWKGTPPCSGRSSWCFSCSGRWEL